MTMLRFFPHQNHHLRTYFHPAPSLTTSCDRPLHLRYALPLDLRADQEVDSTLALLPYQIPSILESVTRVVCSSRVCGVRGDNMTSVKILPVSKTNGKLIDGGSNVCDTGDLTILLDVSDITAIDISVALDGRSTSLDDRITKRGLLPLTLSDGSVYYQTCFYCENMVETIISPAAILASSDVFYYWNQEGCKDPTAPGRIRFTSKDGILSMFFNLEYREGLYYCSSTSSLSIRTLWLGSTVVVLLPHIRQTSTVPHPNPFLHHVRVRSNRKCGSPVSGHRQRVNSISFPVMLLARRLFSNIIHYVQSTSKNRPTSKSKLHSACTRARSTDDDDNGHQGP